MHSFYKIESYNKELKQSDTNFVQNQRRLPKGECSEIFTHTFNQLKIELKKIIYEGYIKLEVSLAMIKNNGSPIYMAGTSDISNKITFKHLVEAANEGFDALTQAIEKLPELDPDIDSEKWDMLSQVVERMKRYEIQFQKSQEQEPASSQLKI